jgi:glycosyltransferase involved in cell wall biosynthesis
MKVLRLIGGLDPAHGGPPQSAMNSIIAAQRAGADTTLAFPIETPRLSSVDDAVIRLQKEGVRVVAFDPSSATSLRTRSWGMNGAMAGWIRREARHSDIIHCHGAWQMATLLATVTKRQDQKLVLTPHESLTGFDIGRASNGALRFLKAVLRRRYVKKFDLIVMASRIEASNSAERGEIPENFAILPHPVHDDAGPQLQTPNQTDSPKDIRKGFLVGFLGRLSGKKNLDLMIRALPILPEKISLDVAGDGPERAGLRSLADQLGVADRVRWLGFVEGVAKAGFLRQIDLLVMPSDFECFGMAAAEAMVHGIPVVVTPQTGIAELVRSQGGGEVTPATTDDLARIIGDLARQPDRMAALSQEAAAAARREFSFAAHGVKLVSHYKRMQRAPNG